MERVDETMKILILRIPASIALCGLLTFAIAAQTQPAGSSGQSGSAERKQTQRGTAMKKHASGAFDVKATPQKPDNKEAEAARIGRMSLDKQFHGDLEATSKGEMLSATTEEPGSAGYVAMERVTGTLNGRSGSFVLQHSGTMKRGAQHQNITVLPDSGTDALEGISGSMTIIIKEGGKHFYEFDYQLAR
jgi:Protein of unknown function (DUF3224)